MNSELLHLYINTVPLPGRPGWRIDREGREWYSAAWIGYHDNDLVVAAELPYVRMEKRDHGVDA